MCHRGISHAAGAQRDGISSGSEQESTGCGSSQPGDSRVCCSVEDSQAGKPQPFRNGSVAMWLAGMVFTDNSRTQQHQNIRVLSDYQEQWVHEKRN